MGAKIEYKTGTEVFFFRYPLKLSVKQLITK